MKNPHRLQTHLDAIEKTQNKIVHHSVSRLESAMYEAIDFIMDHFLKTGHYAAPTLNSMFAVTTDFYHSVISHAFHSSKKHTPSVKRLAAPGPVGLPRTLRDLAQVFSDHRYWPKVMKRSHKLTDRLRKQYLKKLEKKFGEIAPQLNSGEISPEEAKEHLKSAWRVSRARVETIFQTETTTYFAKTQVAVHERDPNIIGFLFDSTRDSGRTDWCRSRHGLIYQPGSPLLRKNTPSLHWRCRSHLIALANTPYNRKLIEDPDRNPSRRKVTPLPPGWEK